MKIAIYPGSFDPVTNGHLDILKRAAKLFDKVYICIADNPSKNTTFTMDERLFMLMECTKNFSNVEAIYTSELIVKKAKELEANAIVRGLRAVTDFEFEFQLAAANNYIDPSIEMVFLMTSPGLSFISSSSIKEMAMHHVDVSHLVPTVVNYYLQKKY